MLVGDLIMNVRSLGPDNPQLLAPPVISSAVPATVAGGTLGAGSYFVVATLSNSWGETLASLESGPIVIVGPNNAIAVTLSGVAGGFQPVGSYTIKVYIGTVSGQEVTFQSFPGIVSTNATVNFTNVGLVSGTPPVVSSAFLPDTDGSFVSAATMFRWLNDALKSAARITGGIQDAVGIASVSGQRRYVTTLKGQWLRLDQCFYDGWELDLGNKAETFRNRNLTANISISLMVDAQSDTTRLELYWTPSRTSGTATVTSSVAATDTTINISGVVGWLLQDGYALISDGTNSEVISYSAQTGSQLIGCIRGWAGTQPTAFTTGGGAAPVTVQELDIELNGYRMPYVYSPGQSALTLGVPPGWEPFLKDWMVGTFRMAEQETQEGQALQDKASKAFEAWVKSNKQIAGPRQARMYGDYGVRGVVPGGLTGGIIIP